MLAEGVGEYERQLAALEPQLVLLYEDNYNFLTKMCLERMRASSLPHDCGGTAHAGAGDRGRLRRDRRAGSLPCGGS